MSHWREPNQTWIGILLTSFRQSIMTCCPVFFLPNAPKWWLDANIGRSIKKVSAHIVVPWNSVALGRAKLNLYWNTFDFLQTRYHDLLPSLHPSQCTTWWLDANIGRSIKKVPIHILVNELLHLHPSAKWNRYKLSRIVQVNYCQLIDLR